ncbi:hypothetical protein [Variovorax fucosicus]|uniref:hypothetical protein n=1 Tax=Variovorax fucosicus TaxID=3053517 RepID=UPI002576A498|nr:hypothetical protein [Variovorax sp. J22G47]
MLCAKFSISILIAVASVIPVAAMASSETAAIARYFDASGYAVAAMKTSASATRTQNPGLAAALEASLKYFDAGTYEELIGEALDRRLAPGEVQELVGFTSSEAGRKVQAIFRVGTTRSEVAAVEKQIPARLKPAVDRFVTSTVLSRTLAAIESDEARAARRAYGEELMCAHFANADRAALERLKQTGKCPKL